MRKSPRLAQPDARRLVRGGEHPGQHLVVDRVGQEPVPDVPAGRRPAGRRTSLSGAPGSVIGVGHVSPSLSSTSRRDPANASEVAGVRAPRSAASQVRGRGKVVAAPHRENPCGVAHSSRPSPFTTRIRTNGASCSPAISTPGMGAQQPDQVRPVSSCPPVRGRRPRRPRPARSRARPPPAARAGADTAPQAAAPGASRSIRTGSPRT